MSPAATHRALIERPVPPDVATRTLLSTLHDDLDAVMKRQPNVSHVSALPEGHTALPPEPDASVLGPSAESWHWFAVEEQILPAWWGPASATRFVAGVQRTADGYNSVVDHPRGLVMRGRTWVRRGGDDGDGDETAGAGGRRRRRLLLCDEVEFDPRSLLVRSLMWFVVGSWHRAHEVMLERTLSHARERRG